jgi:hypothetical protein
VPELLLLDEDALDALVDDELDEDDEVLDEVLVVEDALVDAAEELVGPSAPLPPVPPVPGSSV